MFAVVLHTCISLVYCTGAMPSVVITLAVYATSKEVSGYNTMGICRPITHGHVCYTASERRIVSTSLQLFQERKPAIRFCLTIVTM